jgi:osmotically-inducible protein OsmY
MPVKLDGEITNDMEHGSRLPPAGKRPDSEILRDALETLHDALPCSSEHLKVVVNDGWLTLEGYLDWGYQRDRAQRAVRGPRGVIGISDNLKPKLRVAASDVKRQIERGLKRGVALDANRAPLDTGSSKITINRLKSWAALDGFSVHGESVGR